MQQTLPVKSPPLRWPELLGIVFFALLVHHRTLGLDTLHPANVTWLLHGDPAQHYLGWQFFRQEDWHWPLGRIAGFGIPGGTSIVFTDAIPMLALALKPFSSLLPAEFQYFGPWMLVCLILQGYWAARLLTACTPHATLRIACACLLICSPPLFMRAYGHEALMAQWLLLAALHGYLQRWPMRSWLTVILAGALIHAYLLVMLLGFWAASLLEQMCRKPDEWKKTALQLPLVVVPLVLTMHAAGYFIPNTQLSGEGYGFFSMNLLALIQPGIIGPEFGRARIMPDIPVATGGQYEGYLYLGAGMLALGALALLLLAWQPRATERTMGAATYPTTRLWPLCAAVAIFFTLALSTRITFAGFEIATVPLPDDLQQKLAIFRASGRFGWPLFYLLSFTILATLCRRLAPRPLFACLVLALILQVFDQSTKYRVLRQRIDERASATSPLTSAEWSLVAARATRLILLPPFPDAEKKYIPFAHLAARHGLATNAAHTARATSSDGSHNGESFWQELLQETPVNVPPTLYVLPAPEAVSRLPASVRQRVLRLDGHFVLPPSPSLNGN